MRNARLTARDRDRIVAALSDPGVGFEAIAAAERLSLTTVRGIARANGFTRVGRFLRPAALARTEESAHEAAE